MRILVIVALVAFSVAAIAQNQGQSQQGQTQQSQTQQTQTQGQQPQKKKSFWQRVKDAQNALQNGQGAAQNTVQQGTGAVQNAGQQVQNGAQQGIQAVQSNGQGGTAGNQGNAAFSGGGGGAGSCGTSCFDAGPFQANVSQMTMSQQGYWHILRMNIQFHNSTNQPLIIAYHDGSMVMVDNNGNTYIPAGGNPGQLQGMGIDRGEQTDSSFVLGPGQTGNALFSVARTRGPNSAVATSYAYNFTIDELQPQNGALAIPVRQYTLNFPSLAPGASNVASFPSGAPANGFVSGGTATSAAAAGNAAAGTSQAAGTAVKGGTAVPANQRIVNGRTAVATHPATPVNSVAMKSASAMTTKPSTAVKTVPAKTQTTTPPKKKTVSTTTTPATR